MKVVRFDRLLASTALGLVLLVSGHAANAQQQANEVQIVVPLPDAPPPPTARDFGIDVPAPAQTAAPAASMAAPAPVAADETAVSDKLREMVTGKALDRVIGRKAENAAVVAFYSARGYKPLWVANGAAADRAKSAIGYLTKADAVGLEPGDYPTPDFNSASTPDALAEAELKLTASALTFARHAQVGRVHYTRVAADIQFDQKAPEPADVLNKLAANDDAGATLDSYNPPMAQFKALRAKLAELRAGNGIAAAPAEEKSAPKVHVPEGKIMRLGMKDPRVVALRKRLDVKGDKDNTLYDEDVRDAVRTFQTVAELHDDGNVGPNTLRALNGEKKATAKGPSADPIDTIIVNMERWRWFPRELGNPHVIVNVPDYRLTLYNNGKVYWTTKIVAGKPVHATPMISSEMKFITVNPTWNVPPSIIENEYLPALQQDPQALERIGLKLEQAADGTVRIYQPPGAGNALGRIRFNFPNKFLVYQHDTPDKHLFSREERAFSHGCMRVENPLMYGEKLLSLALPDGNYSAAKLEKMFGGSEININFPKNIWVHLTYQTAFADEEGKFQFRKDVYGRDQRMIAILKGSERRIADLAIERAPNTSSRPVRMPVGMYGGTGPSGPSFFDMLFGGGRQVEPAYRPRGSVGRTSNNRNTYYR
ncbi:MAG: L,D-transpeptidase family protein [Pseudolabrys sp.]|nr:L,D-transpeptidase family protein [Pseudolabrys sp.]MDP2294455.1 L,D-transpeptidase family protein [Pseudolabrys sp.]